MVGQPVSHAPGALHCRLPAAEATNKAAQQGVGGASPSGRAPQDAGITMRSGEVFSLDEDDSHVYVDARESREHAV